MTITGMLDRACDPFAPTQVYLVLAITVTGVSWLLAPKKGELPPRRRTQWATLLIGAEIAHVILYGRIAESYGEAYNARIHVTLVLAAYLSLVLFVVIPWLDKLTELKQTGATTLRLRD